MTHKKGLTYKLTHGPGIILGIMAWRRGVDKCKTKGHHEGTQQMPRFSASISFSTYTEFIHG